MKQFVLKKNGNEFDEESKKYDQMNNKLTVEVSACHAFRQLSGHL